MRLQIVKSKNAKSYYMVKSTYENGKRSNKVVERLGTEKEIQAKYPNCTSEEWAKSYVNKKNEEEKLGKEFVIIKNFSPSKTIPKDKQYFYNGGYLFLEKIYNNLQTEKICKKISNDYKFEYNLNSILSRLIYSRILSPCSKRSTYEESKKFIEEPQFECHQIYRALDILTENKEYIQAELYKNSKKISNRNTGILYYDCTNYFFEIEEAEGLKQYGKSKENRPNPIVQMGLFIDGDGIPLAFNINKGNTNEQITLKPLENQILEDFKLSKFIVCTDAGLSSKANKKFNSIQDRAYITTQSIKKMKSHIKEWSLDTSNFYLDGDNSGKTYDVSKFNEKEKEKYLNEIFHNVELSMIGDTFSKKIKCF